MHVAAQTWSENEAIYKHVGMGGWDEIKNTMTLKESNSNERSPLLVEDSYLLMLLPNERNPYC